MTQAREATLSVMQKAGRCANGFESDRGIVTHAVVDGIEFGMGTALCGTKPGRRSVGWVTPYTTKIVTCERCRKAILKAVAAVQGGVGDATRREGVDASEGVNTSPAPGYASEISVVDRIIDVLMNDVGYPMAHGEAEQIANKILIVTTAMRERWCPSCGGNDADHPCAYPGENKRGCMRDERLATREPVPSCEIRDNRPWIQRLDDLKSAIIRAMDANHLFSSAEAVSKNSTALILAETALCHFERFRTTEPSGIEYVKADLYNELAEKYAELKRCQSESVSVYLADIESLLRKHIGLEPDGFDEDGYACHKIIGFPAATKAVLDAAGVKYVD